MIKLPPQLVYLTGLPTAARFGLPVLGTLIASMVIGLVYYLDIQSGAASMLVIGAVLLAASVGGVLIHRLKRARMQATDLASEHQLLRRSEERFRALVHNTSDVILLTDAQGRIQYQSPATTDIWGYNAETLEGKPWLVLIHPDDMEHAEILVSQIADCPGMNLSIEGRIQYADETWHTCEIVANDLLADSAVNGVAVTIRDITDRKRYEEQLTRLAYHDPLSRLPNRSLFLSSVQHALSRTNQPGKHIAVLFVDLDNFKVINDSLGHPIGDQLLVAVAERLQAAVRPSDTVARLGGDEFTLLLEDLPDVNQAVFVAERILEQFQTPFTIEGHIVFSGASIGIALSSPSHTHPDELLRNADLAMYRAKTGGKASYAVFDRSLGERVRDRLTLENDLRRALELHELRVYYQPVINLDTNTISEVEALVRWMHPERGIVPPLEFIPIAEETGLILPIGQWVLAEACRQAVLWHTQFPSDPPLMMSVNLSPRQFQDSHLVQMVAEALQTSGLSPQCLKLEITESMMMQDSTATSTLLGELKQLGVELAIDDFGTGYCSLNYLKRFPVDTLKIDRSFITGLGQNAEDTAIVRAVIAFAKALNLSVTGEGIETAMQVAELNALDCERGQGFFFGEPLPHDALDAWFAGERSELPVPIASVK